MTRMRTAVMALTLSVGALLVTAAPAGAAGQDPFIPPAPSNPISDTGWEPAVNQPPGPFTRACGTRISLDEVDRFFTLEERVREYAGGTTRIDIRGQLILKVTAADGRHARLDATGPGAIIINEKRGVVDVYFRGASVLLPDNPIFAAALRRADMPRFSAFMGNFHLRDRFDPATGDSIGSRVISRPRFVTNACHLLVR